MKRKKKITDKFRIPLPKQVCQAFKPKKEYNRKDKSWKNNSGSFCFWA
jgi:hypothetical protein